LVALPHHTPNRPANQKEEMNPLSKEGLLRAINAAQLNGNHGFAQGLLELYFSLFGRPEK